MAHAVPKIEYNVQSKTGTSAGGSDFLNLSSVTGIEVGMYIRGTDIPANTTVLAIGSGVQMSANATGISTAFEFYRKIEFDFPPIEVGGESELPQDRTSTALSGMRQVSIDFTEGVRTLTFSFLSQTLYTSLKSFYDNFGKYGDEFRYYDDKTSGTYTTVEMRAFDWLPEKITHNGVSYVWRLPFTIRRVI